MLFPHHGGINFIFSSPAVIHYWSVVPSFLSDMGSFKSYVTQMGVGVSDFPEKSVMKV